MTDDQLAGWFREVELSPGSDRFVALTTAIPDVVGKMGVGSALGMVRLAHGQGDESAFELLRSAVTEHDASYAARADDLETKVVAAAAVAAAIDDGGQLGAACALSVQCEQFIGAAPAVLGLTSIADRHLSSRSRSSRATQLETGIADPRTIKKYAPAEGEVPTAEAVAAHLDAQIAAVIKWAKDQMAVVARRADHDVTVASEETDILWWAFSGRSELTGTAWADAPAPDALPIAMGFELAGLIRFDVPPSSAAAILSRVAASSADSLVTIQDAAEAAWAAVPECTGIPNLELFPITLSLRECREFGGAEAWRASVLRWGVTTTASRRVVDMATQTLRELLLLRMLGDE